MNGNPILLVTNAGRGSTPVPNDALYALGEKVSINTAEGWLAGTVTAVVPPGVSPEIAFADHTEQDRPLMCTVNRKRTTTYIVTIDPQQPSYWITKPRNIKALSDAVPA